MAAIPMTTHRWCFFNVPDRNLRCVYQDHLVVFVYGQTHWCSEKRKKPGCGLEMTIIIIQHFLMDRYDPGPGPENRQIFLQHPRYDWIPISSCQRSWFSWERLEALPWMFRGCSMDFRIMFISVSFKLSLKPIPISSWFWLIRYDKIFEWDKLGIFPQLPYGSLT